MRTSWVNVMKASALGDAGPKVTADQTRVEALWSWSPKDVWLARVRPARERVSPPSEGGLRPPRSAGGASRGRNKTG
jgi:hypothetical protein